MQVTKNNVFINKVIKHYLKYDRDNPFIFISSLLAFIGIAAGVMVLMLAMGIMNGTQKEFKKRLFVMNYPLTLIPIGYQNANDDIVTKLSSKFPELKFSPYYTTQVISKSGSNVNGSILYGVDFEKERQINEVFDKSAQSSIKVKSKFKMVTGESLAVEMGVQKGQKLTLYFSEQQAIGFGSMPVQKRFTIDATFDSGLNTYDKAIIYTTHEAFQKVLKRPTGIYDGIHIYSNDAMNDLKHINAYLKSIDYHQGVRIQGWWEQNASFFAAMEMEKKALFLVLLLIILVAALNIISSLLMTVMSRRTEIALMKTLGATSSEIKSIFFKLGAIIGLGGIIAGTFLGLIGMWILTTFDLISLSEDVYGFSKLPIDLTLLDFVLIIIGAIVIVLASSIYPAKKASSVDPLNVLRNE
ncbi:MAG: Lipoprotein releasing system transmembrane protein LolC [uncultured Sulfurovum sp.]|uniref:Lipoprotein releasing system transmembrane protein LolC n=1 Tax=uncultured Sulfurovum sp. TaxID=269237 RepID=A0A6S6T0A6_9BACT|nr:MAG: Lipoprotein releasing system transmembrane protein LolC [uncultured Sulfurovum sp.]